MSLYYDFGHPCYVEQFVFSASLLFTLLVKHRKVAALWLFAPERFVHWKQKPVTQKTAYGWRKSVVVCPLCHVLWRIKAMMYSPWREMTKKRDTKVCGNKYVEERLYMYSHI